MTSITCPAVARNKRSSSSGNSDWSAHSRSEEKEEKKSKKATAQGYEHSLVIKLIDRLSRNHKSINQRLPEQPQKTL